MEEINRKRKRVEAEAGEGASASGKHTAPPNVRTASSSSGGSGGGSRAATDAKTADGNGNNGENKTACDTDSGSKFVLQNVQLAEHLRHTPQPLSGKDTRAATSNLAAPTSLLSLRTAVYIYIERHLKISLLTLFCLFVTPFVAAGVRADGETRAIETDTLTRLVRIYLSFTKHWRNETLLCLVVFFPFFLKKEVDGVALCSLIVLR